VDSPTINALLFDLGGVLVHFTGFEELERLLPAPHDPAAIRMKWIESPSVREFESGVLSPEEFGERFVEEWRLEIEPENLVNEFRSWLRGLYPDVMMLLGQLKPTIRIGCLSNSNILHTAWHRATFESTFEFFYFSNEMGVVKPDREIFRLVIGDLGCEPDQIGFLDDNPMNVEAAQKEGILAELVESFADLEDRLSAMGVLVGS
jgi:putative hydrolase of the HAD superfamily